MNNSDIEETKPLTLDDANAKQVKNPGLQEKSLDEPSKVHTSLQGGATQEEEPEAKRKKKIKWLIIGAAITIVIVLAIVLPIILTKSSNPDVPPDPPGPPPEPPLSNVTTYNPYKQTYRSIDDESNAKGIIQASDPYSFQKHLQALQHSGAFGISQHDFTTLPREFPVGPNNKFIQNLSFSFYMTDFKVAALELTDADSKRYSIPEDVVKKPGMNPTMRLEMLGFKLFDNPFSFQFADIRDSSNVFVHTNDSTLVFLDKFIQMDFNLPSQRVYGFGERYRQFTLGEGTWTMWAKGQNNTYDDGYGGKGSYGVHPFILIQGKNKGDYFGMFFRNSNAQSPVLKFNATTGKSHLSYITIGGQIEIYFFIHGSAKEVIQSYIKLIGTPKLPPMWSLGWHQASYSYNTQDDVQKMIDGYKNAGLPLDGVWLDIPYMDNFQNFMINKTAFPNIKGLADTLHQNNRRLVTIVDGGMSADNFQNKYYLAAQNGNALIKSSIHADNRFKGALVNKVWPNHTVFMDWFSPKAQSVWAQGLQDLYEETHFDGLWLDMNEATGFVSGELDTPPVQEEEINSQNYNSKVKRFMNAVEQQNTDPRTSWYHSFLNQTNISTYNLPFIPGWLYSGNLDNLTLSLNATHPVSGLTEYDVHSLYGHMMSEHTFTYLTGSKTYEFKDTRPFILTRSSFAGTGRFATHWLGDNYRNWEAMKYSISGIMNFQMFGIPLTGADVGGFFGTNPITTDQDLISRWIQLATFYPFARLHYSNESTPSEAYQLKDDFQRIARESMFDRYQYLRLLYTCLFEASQWGSTCFDPLFYHYPQDDKAYLNVEDTFIFANAIKVSPILTAGVKTGGTFDSYFPKGQWVSLVNPSLVVSGNDVKQLPATHQVQSHLKQGSLIPFQNNTGDNIKQIHSLLETPITLIAHRDDQGKASGTLLVDDGHFQHTLDDGDYEYYTISLQAKTIQKRLAGGKHAGYKYYKFDKFVILNAGDLSDTDFACYFTPRLDIVQMKLWFDPTDNALHLIASDLISFSDFRQIIFGSTNKKELNMCDPLTYQYKIKAGEVIDLSGSKASFTAVHSGKVSPDLTVDLNVISTNTVNIKWTFSKTKDGYLPFQVPEQIINIKPSELKGLKLSNFLNVKNDDYLSFEIKSPSKQIVATLKEILLDRYLNYYSQTLQTSSGDDFRGIFGLGERVQDDLQYDDGVYSMWNRDAGMPFDDGKPTGKNVYGTHPFYMYKNSPGTWVGVFTKLAAAQDWYLKNDKPTGKVDVTLIAAGGMADIYYIVDSEPGAVAASYLDLVGKPVLIPQWALGWHQCRWGYTVLQDLIDVVGNYSAFNLPLDTQWNDIDYLFNYRDFTYDSFRYKNLSDFVDYLHNNKSMYYVPILDGGIAMRDQYYPAYQEGVKENIFVKIGGVNGQTLVGQVWPNDAAYPDWFHPNASSWWKQELTYLYDMLPFDGLWEDMNEASNFCGGVCYGSQKLDVQKKYDLKYTPTGRDLESQSLPLDGYHYGDLYEVDVHSLFGTMEVSVTHDWFKEQKKRTMIIERSSIFGMGKFGSRWLGDQQSEPRYMAQSVTGSMSMHLFGIPLIGTDLCGFGGNTNPELCARWHMVGAFQTFSRNHNGWDTKAQEPYVFHNDYYEAGVSYTDIMRYAMRLKYSLIRYMYTNMFLTSQNGGKPFYRAVFFDYPEDIHTTLDVHNNVLLGDSLKLSLLSDSVGLNSTQFYFPKGTWCNILNASEPCFNTSKGEFQTRRTLAYDAYLHIKEGSIVPMQNATLVGANTTHDLQQQPVDFHILGKLTPWSTTAVWGARGTYINDDGLNVTTEGNFNQYELIADETIVSQGKQEVQRLRLQFATTTTAANYLDNEGCSAINKNDYLGKIIFYNGQGNRIKNSRGYTVIVFLEEGDVRETKIAKYSANNDTLSIDLQGEYCLSKLRMVEFHSF